MAIFNWKRKSKEVVEEQRSDAGMRAFFAKSYEVSNPKAPTSAFREPPERPDVDIRKQKEEVVALCRSEAQRDGYVIGFIRAMQDAIIGEGGIRLKSQHGDERVEEFIEAAWKKWGRAENIDMANRDSLIDYQNIALGNLLHTGEFIAIKHYFPEMRTFKLEIMDPLDLDVSLNDSWHRAVAYDQDTGRRAENPVRMGIELDAYGKPLYYWFRNSRLSRTLESGYSSVDGKHRVVHADRVIHISLNDIGSNIRGMPWIANSILLCAERKSYEDAVRLRAQINARRLGVIVEAVDAITAQPPLAGKAREELEQTTAATMMSMTSQLKETGMALAKLDKGQDIKYWDNSVPDNTFPPFIKTILEAMAASWGVSFAFVTGDSTKVNFSSGRMGEIKTQNTLRRFRSILIEKLLEPLFDEWILWNLPQIRGTQGGIAVDRAVKHKFIGKGFPAIQPREKAIADQIAIATMQKTSSELIREDGRNPDDVWKERKAEQVKWEELGLRPQIMLPPNTTDVDENASEDDDDSEEDSDDENKEQ